VSWQSPIPHRPLARLRHGGPLWQACCRGDEPAESLSQEARRALVGLLAGRGWSDREIAEHTRMTLYTTARIRSAVAAQRVAADVRPVAA
jgi:hypothetical protein